MHFALCALLIIAIFLAPNWLAVQNGKDKETCWIVRCYSWAFGWTGIGWLFALYIAVKK